MSLVTLLTDYGLGKYVASMKGVILSINPGVTIVDIEHQIPPQNVLEGSFVLASAVRYFPDSVHVAVVDPGVGTDRRPLVVECDRGILVGPDNGILMPAARALGFKGAFQVEKAEYRLQTISHTFHGRDIFAPVAAHLSLGVVPASVGGPVDDPVDLDFGPYEVSSKEVRGRILLKDRFGNLITNVPGEALPAWATHGESLKLRIEAEYELPFLRAYGFGAPGEPLLTVSSEGYLEIAVNQGDASKVLGSRPGDAFVLRKS